MNIASEKFMYLYISMNELQRFIMKNNNVIVKFVYGSICLIDSIVLFCSHSSPNIRSLAAAGNFLFATEFVHSILNRCNNL